MKKIIVAIDGHSSCGKSTMAKELAAYAHYTYVDTGAMYRAVSLYGIRQGWITEQHINVEALEAHLSEIHIGFQVSTDGKQYTTLNGENVEQQIRTLEVANGASRVSTLGFVRRALVHQQQQMGIEKGIVMDGRDIGTVVFPNAELKVFVTASAQVRAQRRYNELKAKGDVVNFDEVLANVIERDERDSNRAESPLRMAPDAKLLDNSNLTKVEQFEMLKAWFIEAVK